MIRSRLPTTARALVAASSVPTARNFATVSPPASSGTRDYKVIVVGGGTAGLTISHQLLRTGKFAENDIAIVDPAIWHHYQPGWTLVGGGLKNKDDLRRPLQGLLDPKLKFYNEGVGKFSPEENSVTLGGSGDRIGYEHLVVAPGIQIDYTSISGLPEALADQNSMVSSIYGYDTCDKVFRTIEKLKNGTAIFTQPAGGIKCAGAPQKAMWLAWDFWNKAGLASADQSSSAIKTSFATATPTMFGVPKYSARLDELRKEKGVEAYFQHDLVSVNGNTAQFSNLADGGKKVELPFDLLHVVPKMGPHAFIKNSALANEAGYVDVDAGTTRHTKYSNVWSAGDASSLPTSKTAAAVTAEAPVLVKNLLQTMEGKEPESVYDGYTSCPLLTEYGKVMLAEFKYGGEPKETFNNWFGIDQGTPRRSFYHLKKDFFPWVYYNSMVKGTWGGPKGWLK